MRAIRDPGLVDYFFDSLPCGGWIFSDGGPEERDEDGPVFLISISPQVTRAQKNVVGIDFNWFKNRYKIRRCLVGGLNYLHTKRAPKFFQLHSGNFSCLLQASLVKKFPTDQADGRFVEFINTLLG